MMPVLGVRMDAETHRDFKVWCVRRDKKMTDVLRRLVKDWVAEQERLEKVREGLEEQRGQSDVQAHS